MSFAQLQEKLESKDAKIAVVGLGMVGLPVAALFASRGFSVVGVDVRADRVAVINDGRMPMVGEEPGLPEMLAEVVRGGKLRATVDYGALAGADVITINVETPVDAQHRPDYRALEGACRSLGPVLKRGALVIVESTVAPGTTERTVRPLLENASGMKAHVDFFLGACPERVMPGKLLSNLREVSRVCGGGTPETAVLMQKLYRHVVSASLDAADTLTAELVKTTENAYRDVQIAFANEVALICESCGADVWRVRELVNKSPGRSMHLPGAGVGGHCIPKDPWLLAHAAQGDLPLRMIPAGRATNEAMPLHMLALLEDGLAAAGRALAGARVVVLGFSYLEESDDTRNSPSEVFVGHLERAGAKVVVHDPFVSELAGDLIATLKGADAAVLMVAHKLYREVDLKSVAAALAHPVLIDGRHVYDRARAQAAGLIYCCVGISRGEG
jgi:UDP-N-acetyl-D-mannosaminuronic acid dehydrogenase